MPMVRLPLDDVIDVNGAAELLGLETKRVTQLLRAGELPGRKLTKVWIMHRPAIEAIAKRRRKWHRNQ